MKIINDDDKTTRVGNFKMGTVISIENDNGHKNYYMVTNNTGNESSETLRKAVDLETGETKLLISDTPAQAHENAIVYLNGRVGDPDLIDSVDNYVKYCMDIYSLVGKDGDTRYFTILSPFDDQILDTIQNICDDLDYDKDVDECAELLKKHVKDLCNVDITFTSVKKVFRT